MSSLNSSEDDRDSFVKAELSKFVIEHTGVDPLSSIDEIVLSYIIGVLESLESADSPDDVFDVDEFTEMMTAYIPLFSNIHITHIYEWMVNLASKLKDCSSSNDKNKTTCPLETMLFRAHERQRSVSENSNQINYGRQPSNSRRGSYPRSNSVCSSQSEDEEKCITINTFQSGEVETLCEMFPHLHVIEVKQFLSIAEGDCEKAVQLILQKEESGVAVNKPIVTKNNGRLSISSKTNGTEDKHLREQILKRYAYIDQDDDVREHKPVAPKNEPKKLIRYRENKIVSMKGERYSEIRKTEDSGDCK